MSRFVRRTAVALLLVGIALLIYALADVALLIFGAALVAVILRALAAPLRRYLHLPQTAAVLVALLLIVGVFAAAGTLFGMQMRAEFSGLAERLPEAWKQVQARIAAMPFGDEILAGLNGFQPDASAMASRVAAFLTTLVGVISNFILVLFAGVYLALSPGLYREGVVKLFPKARAEEVASATGNSGRALRLWLLGQLVSMTVVGILTAGGLWLAGVPSALALGLIAGLAEFVPLVGPVAAAIPGIMVALTQDTSTALWALAVYVVVQQVEGNILTPMVAKKAVSVPPALTLVGVFALGALFGPLGVLFSAPLVVLIFVLVKQLYVRDALGHDTVVPGEDK
ncbi:AI-2E family transporter [Novosphingobium sp. RD2P27]|uniref:AI-2E family transporter n=1 Tax=Novosphingobium kalidii TaxID=3230299 RepID=A0ABV2CWV9_9SPHN